MENAQNNKYHYLKDFEDKEDDLVKVQDKTNDASDINWEAKPTEKGHPKLLTYVLLILANLVAFLIIYITISSYEQKFVKDSYGSATY